MTTTTARPSDERRLHPWSWLFVAAQAAKGFVVPALLVLFASSGNAYELWAAVFVIPITASALLQYAVFRYRLDADELVVRDGVVTRTERHIPYARIQNIDLVQNPVHRMLGVALVRVETASGTRPEAEIRVLSLDAVEEMRAHVFAGRETGRHADAEEREADVLLSVPAGELIRLGIISNKGLVVVGAVLGLLWQRGPRIGPGREALIERYLGSAPDWVTGAAGGSVLSLVLIGASILIAAVVLLRVFSIVWFIVQLTGFTLRRQGDNLRAEYGLMTRITRTIPPLRIQTLLITESPLHRWFKRQSVELRTVGGGEEVGTGLDTSSSQARSQWLAPLVETRLVPGLIQRVLPEVDLTSVQWDALDPGARRRIFRRVLVTSLVAVGIASMALGPSAWAVAPIGAGLAALHARRLVEHAGYALTGWGIVFKWGWWNRRLQIVRYSKVQTVTCVEGPLDRRSGMASLRVDTAGASRGGHTIDIPYLNASVAADLAGRLYLEASHRPFRW